MLFLFIHLSSIQNEFATAFQNFAKGLNEYGLNDTEIGLFSALVLLTATRNGIIEHKQISRTRERIAEALQIQIVQTRSGSTTSLQLMPGIFYRLALAEMRNKKLFA